MSRPLAAWNLFNMMTRLGLFMHTRGADLEVGPPDKLDDGTRQLIRTLKPELWSAAKEAEMLIERIRYHRLQGPR